VLAERLGADVDTAFAVMRSFARRHGLHLTQVANSVIDGTLDVSVGQ
jgi:hypothetical protein